MSPHATPLRPQVLVNEPVTLALPGARAGDLVMIVRQTAQGGCVEAASGGGGVLVEDGQLQMRLRDRNLFLHEATYLANLACDCGHEWTRKETGSTEVGLFEVFEGRQVAEDSASFFVRRGITLKNVIPHE